MVFSHLEKLIVFKIIRSDLFESGQKLDRKLLEKGASRQQTTVLVTNIILLRQRPPKYNKSDW